MSPEPRNPAQDYITFHRHGTSPSGKTEIWHVHARRHDFALLAVIKWYSGWRRYAFYPEPGTIWDRDCLRLVNDHIARLMVERRWARNREAKATA